MLGLDGLSPVIRGGFFDRSIIEEYQLSTSNRLRRWQSRASGSRNSSNMVGKLGRSSVVEQPARPALLPLLLLQPTRLIALTGFHRPSLSFSLVANGALHSHCALSLSSSSSISRAFSFSLRFFFALPLRDEGGKKGNDMEKIRYESGEHRKKWHRGRKLLRRAKRKKKRASETMRPPMEILVGSPFIYFAALPDFLL